MKSLLGILCMFWVAPVLAQTQACPININWNLNALNYWMAYVGNNAGGNGAGAIKDTFSATVAAPVGTVGATAIAEYQLPTVDGIQVLTSSSYDPFGGFATIPTINGYRYAASVKLGSTSISHGSAGGSQGGYIRGLRYRINVPAGPTSVPYTMTYAYAMVLENGTHNSDEQPMISATLNTVDSIITCASPKYLLPTDNDAAGGGTGAALDSAAAYAEGFTPSRQPSPNPNPNSNNGAHLYDVWYKGWREVTFDLSPYRGTQVTLTFEADNCVPGGHFAYAYIALRNTCAGLIITGDTVACTSSDLTYSVPSLANASYQWSFPPGWNIVSGADSNIVQVDVGTLGGAIIAHEINSCANLHDTLDILTAPPTIPGTLAGNNTVCAGDNSSLITLSGNRGSIIDWLYSNNGVSYNTLTDTTTSYTAQNLNATTTYRALIQNGESCAVDTSNIVTVIVDPKSVGGGLTPNTTDICTGQNKGAILNLENAVGGAINWQSSLDGTNWNDFTPTNNTYTYSISGVTSNIQYRVIVKSGVCPEDTSAVAYVNLLPGLFPQAEIDPADTLICYGGTANLTASIALGTSYSWTTTGPFTGDTLPGNIGSTPYTLNAVASPLVSTPYILTIYNTGCPNPLVDTFQINVYPKIIVNAGNDTAVVVNQPLQLTATSTDSGDAFSWSPPTDLSSTEIYNPIAVLGSNIDTIRYTATATAANGCSAAASVLVQVYTTAPDIFVPSAFTPSVNIDNIFRPILVGISSLTYFKVYNRYGNMVYSTTSTEDGWDGKVNGVLQAPQAFVWMVQGTSYLGKTIFKKGTVVLIR